MGKRSASAAALSMLLSSVMLTACGDNAGSGGSYSYRSDGKRVFGRSSGQSSGKKAEPAYAGQKIGNPYEINGEWYYPKHEPEYQEVGLASWYGPGFHGKSTANGEVFDQDDLTAAHKTLPLPCFVKVENLKNGKSLIVRVNDRGPFYDGRIIDLSRGSAKKLDVTGLAKVRVTYLDEETKQYMASKGRIVPDAEVQVASAGGAGSSGSRSNWLRKPDSSVIHTASMTREVIMQPLPTATGDRSIEVAGADDVSVTRITPSIANNRGPVVDSQPVMSVASRDLPALTGMSDSAGASSSGDAPVAVAAYVEDRDVDQYPVAVRAGEYEGNIALAGANAASVAAAELPPAELPSAGSMITATEVPAQEMEIASAAPAAVASSSIHVSAPLSAPSVTSTDIAPLRQAQTQAEAAARNRSYVAFSPFQVKSANDYKYSEVAELVPATAAVSANAGNAAMVAAPAIMPVQQRETADVPSVADMAMPSASSAIVQVASFSQRDNAEKMVQRLNTLGQPAVESVIVQGRELFRVMLMPRHSETGEQLLSSLHQIGLHDARIID